jgi:ubiquinone biosynthesis protein
MPFDQVRDVVEKALGGSLSDHFTMFSEEPIGAASIGQVHRATLRDGMAVAVKVQYPGIADTIRSDVKNLGSLMNLARAQLPRDRVDSYLEEVASVLERESDYLREADNLERFHVVLRDVEGVKVPTPVHELTRKNVLTMEMFNGRRLEDWLATASPEHKAAQGRRLLTAYVEMMHRHGALHADPHPGNFMVLEGELSTTKEGLSVPPIGLLDLGCVRDYELSFTDDLIRLLAAMWHHDVDALQAAWRSMGFSDKGIDPEMIYEWLTLVLEPLLVDREFDFGTWHVQDRLMRFVLDNPKLKTWAPPREVIFYMRVLAGMRGLLHKTGVKLNAYAISRAVAHERGLV